MDPGAGWANAAVHTQSWARVTAVGIVVLLAFAGWLFRDQLGMGGATTRPPVVAFTDPPDTGTPDTGTPDPAPDTRSVRIVTVPVLGAEAADTAPDGSDANKRPVSYQVDNTFDGRRSTAWRAQGDGTGLQLTFQFASPVHILGVGLIPGYDKVDPRDGTDRFREERRITTVDWDFGDDTHVTQDLEDSRALQSVPVDATTSTVRLTIRGTTPPGSSKHDYTAISEVRFRGTP